MGCSYGYTTPVEVDKLPGYSIISFKIFLHQPMLIVDTTPTGMFSVWVSSQDSGGRGYGYLGIDWENFGIHYICF